MADLLDTIHEAVAECSQKTTDGLTEDEITVNYLRSLAATLRNTLTREKIAEAPAKDLVISLAIVLDRLTMYHKLAYPIPKDN